MADLDFPVDLLLDGVLPAHVPDLLGRVHEATARLTKWNQDAHDDQADKEELIEGVNAAKPG